MRIKEFIRKYQDIFYFKSIERLLKGCDSVLDVGCGADSPLKRVKKTFYSEGIDIFEESIRQSKKKKIHDKYKISDIRKIDKIYGKKSFDAVIGLDVIEHLDKKDSIALIKKMENIARKKVLLLTPNGFYHQDAYDDNPYQVHVSEWKLEDLRVLGYRVYGLRGLKYLRGEYATIKYKPWFFWGIIVFFSELPLFFFPKASYHLFAVKNIDRS
ncbi:MAG: class I SAM-dependent methyltransferase [Candidatus Levybacteria bacterium]|nr:class I SAM-dependent methyltransferase [Candidatus Levybacteria bacterium]